ncbi:MAG: GNAT family N-acetyltransferase [Pseudomonadota bacterium]|nr:GNAT family N-acetyltransferase [Pseudomonadota bacterium]
MASNKAIVRRRLGPWTEAIRLSNRRELVLRPISPLDSEPLRAGFTALSPEEIRLRFMHPITELTPEYARQLTHLIPNREFALVATEPLPAGEALIGAVARLSVDPDTKQAEFALLVGRPLSSMGLGSYMLRKLIQYARRRKLKAIHGDVLVENAAMLRLCDRLDFSHRTLEGEHGIIRVWKDL